jgi:hypothetical protein
VPPSAAWRVTVAGLAGGDAGWTEPTEQDEWRGLLPLFSYGDLEYLLRTPSVARRAPRHSPTLSRAKNFVSLRGNKVHGIYVAQDGDSVLVVGTVESSRRKQNHTVLLLFPPPAAEAVGVNDGGYSRFRLRDMIVDRYCATCLFGTSGNCTHIAALLLRIAQLQGIVEPEDRRRDRDVAENLYLGSRNEGVLDEPEESE